MKVLLVRRFGIRTLLIAITVCAVGLALYPWPRAAKTTSFEDLTKHPVPVQTVIRKLQRMPGGCSLEDFELELEKIGNVEVPFQHFKDFEFYWSIETGSSSAPLFIIAGNFMPTDGYLLTHATVNIVEQSGSGWRTIWLADYTHDSPDFFPPRIRGQANPGG